MSPDGDAHQRRARIGSARAAKDVVALAVSVDPKGDTRSAVDSVRPRRIGCAPQFHYLTGSATALERIWRLYNVTPVRQGGPDSITRSTSSSSTGAARRRVLFDCAREARGDGARRQVLLDC